MRNFKIHNSGYDREFYTLEYFSHLFTKFSFASFKIAFSAFRSPII